MPEPTKNENPATRLSSPPDEYGEQYAEHLLRVYELYERSAQAISDRRQIANSFYLTLCTTIVGALAAMNSNPGFLIPFSLTGVAICGVWLRSIHAYRGINSAKFKVLHELEPLLPVRPYTYEWELLEHGNNSKVYTPFSNIEEIIPYLIGLVMLSITALNPAVWSTVIAVFSFCCPT